MAHQMFRMQKTLAMRLNNQGMGLACRHQARTQAFQTRRHVASMTIKSQPLQVPRPKLSTAGKFIVGFAGASVGLGLSMFGSSIFLEPSPPGLNRAPLSPSAATAKRIDEGYYDDPNVPLPASPTGGANLYELGFGSVCGICAGIFIKKGIKAAAFLLGGVFVLLQYFNSLHWLKVDWATAENQYKKTFYTTSKDGIERPPTIVTAWRWLVNFVTADFQPRASFIAGLLLGLRVG